MASAQWGRGKYHSATEAKAHMRHNDPERRGIDEHANKHIDKTQVYRDRSYYGLSYEEKCRKYDQLVAEGSKDRRMSSGKNAAVTMQGVVVYEPAGMKEMPDEVFNAWSRRVGDLARERWADCMIDMETHCSEVHDYIDPETKEESISCRHGHLEFVPLVDGKLNGKAFSSRKNIIEFNNAVQEMTLNEFGMEWNDGTKKKGNKPVEELKAASEKAEIEKTAELMAERNVEKREQDFMELQRREYNRLREWNDDLEEQEEQNRKDAEQNRKDAEKNEKQSRKLNRNYLKSKADELDEREARLDAREAEIRERDDESMKYRENAKNAFNDANWQCERAKWQYDKAVNADNITLKVLNTRFFDGKGGIFTPMDLIKQMRAEEKAKVEDVRQSCLSGLELVEVMANSILEDDRRRQRENGLDFGKW